MSKSTSIKVYVETATANIFEETVGKNISSNSGEYENQDTAYQLLSE